jgi:uncharacterized protein YndB with AHSA1/START domain
VVRAPDGSEMHLHGHYRLIERPERLVTSEANDDCAAEAGSESISTTVLTERNELTTLTTTQRYPSKKIRDDVLRSGMEHGRAEGFDRLAEAIGSIKPIVTA